MFVLTLQVDCMSECVFIVPSAHSAIVITSYKHLSKTTANMLTVHQVFMVVHSSATTKTTEIPLKECAAYMDRLTWVVARGKNPTYFNFIEHLPPMHAIADN